MCDELHGVTAGYEPCQIGLTSPFTTWHSGDPVGYENWGPLKDGSGPYATIIKTENGWNQPSWGGTWDDTSSAEATSYICRFVAGSDFDTSQAYWTATVSLSPPACCGNAVVQGDEQCDDGNGNPEDVCDTDCIQSGPLLYTYDAGDAGIYGPINDGVVDYVHLGGTSDTGICFFYIWGGEKLIEVDFWSLPKVVGKMTYYSSYLQGGGVGYPASVTLEDSQQNTITQFSPDAVPYSVDFQPVQLHQAKIRIKGGSEHTCVSEIAFQ